MDGSLNSNSESILSAGTITTILNLGSHHVTDQPALPLARRITLLLVASSNV